MSFATQLGHGLALGFLLTVGPLVSLGVYVVLVSIGIARSLYTPMHPRLTRWQSVTVDLLTFKDCVRAYPTLWVTRVRYHWRVMLGAPEEPAV
jgi:hypothetical protein